MLKNKRLEKEILEKDKEKEKAIKTAKEEIKAEKEEKQKILKTVEDSLKILGKRGRSYSQSSV